MKQDIKICLRAYKILYSIMYVVILSLIRGISSVDEIGGALDANMALLTIVFCAETYVMERSANRYEVFSIFPMRSKVIAVCRRLLVQNIYLFLLSYMGYFCFFWQNPWIRSDTSVGYQYGIYAAAITVTILFFSILTMTISNIMQNQWAGIGISLILWLIINSKSGEKAFGKFNIFAYGFRSLDDVNDMTWMFGKALGFAAAVIMIGMIPCILKKRG